MRRNFIDPERKIDSEEYLQENMCKLENQLKLACLGLKVYLDNSWDPDYISEMISDISDINDRYINVRLQYEQQFYSDDED